MRAAVAALPDGVSLEEFPIGTLPHFDQDLEADPPATVTDFQRRLRETDGLMIFTPEYNGAMPGVLKNALDWGSRPSGASSIAGTPVTLFGAAAGRFGTARAQVQLRHQFVVLDMPDLHKPEFYLPSAGRAFDDQSTLIDDDARALIARQVAAFVDWVRVHPKAN
jgi:chromate reductase, NAD(P)H dehydrogenase (quinone)